MKVRDIKQYRELVLVKRKDIDYDSFCLGQKEEPLLKDFYGSGKNIDNIVGQISKFAKNTQTQIFYEFLQNADDARASKLAIIFNENWFLVVNNGEPFKTDGTEAPGQLRSFLNKEDSEKAFDDESIGKYGLGSKLLYDLLTNQDAAEKKNERLTEAIITNLKSPILFSWSGIEQWNELKYWKKNDAFIHQNCKETNAPLLTKILYAYYPAYFQEKKKLRDGTEKELFSTSDVESLQSLFFGNQNNQNCFFNKQSEFSFEKGTAILIPLGEGVAENLQAAINDTNGNLINRLATSLSFLKNTKKIFINDVIIKPIYKQDYTIEVQYEGKKKDKVGNCQPYTFDVKILLPTEINVIDENFCNFYQFLPISNETKGLGFIINAEELELIQNRQEVDWDNYSKERIKIIGEKLVEKLSEISESNKPLYFHFLKCFAKGKGNFLEEYLENPIKEFLLKNLPSNSNQNVENIKIKSTKLNINPNEAGLDYHWLDESFKDNHGDFKQKFEQLKECNISNLLGDAKADIEKVKGWIEGLSESNYKLLLSELTENPNFPFIKTSKDNVISQSELKSNETIIPLTSKTKDLKAIFDAQHIEYTDVALFEYERLLPSINDTNIIARITTLIKRENLNENQKHTIFTTFKGNFKDKVKDLAIFKNRKGSFYKLGELIKNDTSIAPSGILYDFQIDPTEPYFEEYDAYFLKENEVWKFIEREWSRIKVQINTNTYYQAIKDLENLYSCRKVEYHIVNNRNIEKYGQLNANIDWVLTTDNTLTTPSAAFLYKNLAKLNHAEYDLICDFITQNTGWKKVSKLVFDVIKDVGFCKNWEIKSSKSIHDNLKENKYLISKELVAILLKIDASLLSYFVFTEQNGQLYLEKKNERKQFYSADNELVVFLENNNYVNLPILIYEQNNNLNELKIESDEFAAELITNPNIGAHRALIGMVNNCNIQTKLSYLHSLQRLDIISNQQYRYENYEYKVIEMMSNQQLSAQIPNYKNKIFIDGQQLSSIQYTDTVTVPNCETSFSLRDLEGYNGANLNVIRANFINLHTTLFDATEKPLNQIFINQVTNGEQVGFLLATDNWDFDDCEVSESLIIQALFNHKLKKIEKIFTNLTTWIFFDDNSLLLNEEKIPNWLRQWADNDDKKKWLKENKLRFDNCSAINIRKNYNQNTSWNENWLKKEVETKDHANRTFKWLSEQGNYSGDFQKNCIAFEQEYVIKNDSLPNYLLAYSLENSAWQLISNKILDTDNSLYFKQLENNVLEKFKDKLLNQGINYLIPIGAKPDTKFKKAIDEEYYIVEKKDKIDELQLENCNEWAANFYKIWKNEFTNYTIKVSSENIPAITTLEYNDVEIEDSNSEECKTDRKNNNRIIYVKANYSQPKTVLSVIEKHLEAAFGNESDKFVKLQSLFIENLSEGEGNVNIPNATEAQKRILEANSAKILENIEAIKAGHFGKYDEEGEIKEDDEIPNRAKISGRIGELAMYFWLKNHKRFDVKDNAKDMQPYDLLLNRDSKDFHLEIKTKAGSFNENGGSIPIFLRQSQKRWIKENKVEHYFLTTVSLKDIGLYEIYKEYRDKTLDECEREMTEVLKSKMNETIYNAINQNEFHMRLTSHNRQDDPFS